MFQGQQTQLLSDDLNCKVNYRYSESNAWPLWKPLLWVLIILHMHSTVVWRSKIPVLHLSQLKPDLFTNTLSWHCIFYNISLKFSSAFFTATLILVLEIKNRGRLNDSLTKTLLMRFQFEKLGHLSQSVHLL